MQSNMEVKFKPTFSSTPQNLFFYLPLLATALADCSTHSLAISNLYLPKELTRGSCVWQTLTIQHANIIQQDMAISFCLRQHGVVGMIGDEMCSINAPSGLLSHDSDVESADDLVSSLRCVGRGECERCKIEHAWAMFLRSCQSTQHHCILIIIN